MKNNKNAFTFVEILFVISIISFLTFSSVMYFNNFVDRKKIDGDIYLIKSSFEELDSKVKNNEIYDYEIKFSGKLYYLLRLNQVINPTKINFSMNEDTKNFNMTTNLTNPGIWDIKTYIVDKVLDVKSIDQQGVFTWTLNQYSSYNIYSTLDWGEDKLWIFYFSLDNLSSSWITTNFAHANTKLDKTWAQSHNFILKNVNNKFKFYSGSTEWKNIDEVYLFFEKNWIEKHIKISNLN